MLYKSLSVEKYSRIGCCSSTAVFNKHSLNLNSFFSISHTNAAPAGSEESNRSLSGPEDFDYNDDDDYSDVTTGEEAPETAENRLMPLSSSTSTTTTFRPIFSE